MEREKYSTAQYTQFHTVHTVILSSVVLRMWCWFTDYIGTIQLDPTKELAEIPNHSAFFIISPDNR